MSSIGADLPPHLLAKRKRQQDEQTEDANTTSAGAKPDSSSETPEKRQRVIGPHRSETQQRGTPPAHSRGADQYDVDIRTAAAPSRRVAGPAMPPAPLGERPEYDPESSDDADDDLGPALPTSDNNEEQSDDETNDITIVPAQDEPERLRRDDWMTMAPAQDDLAARMDPTKIRARGFNTGKAARAGDGGTGNNAAWHETAEQKQKRLADEVLGISTTAARPQTRTPQVDRDKAERDEKTARKVREAAEKARGPSLLDRHQQGKPDAVEDDPSKRAFNYEKDMGNASRITGSQKREMISKAGNYSSRFSGGSYL